VSPQGGLKVISSYHKQRLAKETFRVSFDGTRTKALVLDNLKMSPLANTDNSANVEDMYRYVLVALLLAQPRPEPLLRIEAPLELAALRVNLKVFQRRYKMQIAVFLPDIAIKLGVIDPLRKANPRCVHAEFIH